MAVLFSNNAATTLASAITLSATTITVTTGAGASFPTITSPDFFYATLIDSSNNIEIVKVTARAGDTMTVTRAQEGTTARAYASGDKFELRITAAGLGNKLDKDTGGTLGGKLTLPASTTSAASATFPHGVAPTSFTNGDVWSTTAAFFGRLSGATITFSYSSLTETLTNKSFDLGNNTLTGTVAQFNTALAGDDFVTLTGTETLTNKTLTAPTVSSPTVTGGTFSSGTINASNSVSDTGTIASSSPGFRGIPQNPQTSAYTLQLTDQGKHISITTGGITIPANASVTFPIGATIVVFNNSATSQNIAITTDTMYLAGQVATGTRALASYGLATLVKVGTTTWVISGAGVS